MAPLILVYDAEDPACRRRVDWLQARDRRGLLVAFPFHNAELVRMAPELAGRPFQAEVHALDSRSRATFQGPAILAPALDRTPAWIWLAWACRLEGLAALVYRLIGR